MEIDVSTTGATAASAILGNLDPQTSPKVSQLTTEQQAAIQTAVSVLLGEAGIVDTDPVQVHFAASPEGKWAVLRVAVVLEV